MSKEVLISEFIGRSLRHLITQHPFHLNALRILLRRPEGMTVDEFDRVHAPRGSIIRADLSPLLLTVRSDRVMITETGKFTLNEADQPPWNAEA